MRFVDTSYWVALLVRRDGHHEAARALWSHEPGALLCTNHVLGETWTFLRRRAGHEAAVAFLEAVQGSPRVTLEHVDQATEVEALEWLCRHDEREYSFVDATSFAVMRRRASRRARVALPTRGAFAKGKVTAPRW